jgi:hypothetical protein
MQQIKEVKLHMYAPSTIFFNICVPAGYTAHNPTQNLCLIILGSPVHAVHKSSLDHMLGHLYPSLLAYQLYHLYNQHNYLLLHLPGLPSHTTEFKCK